jgi:hypothetical protein
MVALELAVSETQKEPSAGAHAALALERRIEVSDSELSCVPKYSAADVSANASQLVLAWGYASW